VKCLVDVGVSRTTVQVLRGQGHEVLSLIEEHLERLSDAEILQKAKQEACIVVTFDLDFADLLALGAHILPSVIIFRLYNQTPSSVTPRLLQVLEECGKDLVAGAIVTVEDSRYRLRRLPLERA
jgi:predicted nuclease of predicted toxin-antitoxin system